VGDLGEGDLEDLVPPMGHQLIRVNAGCRRNTTSTTPVATFALKGWHLGEAPSLTRYDALPALLSFATVAFPIFTKRVTQRRNWIYISSRITSV